MLSFKALASSSKQDSISPTLYTPIQLDSFVCFPIYQAGSILDSLKACEALYLYTLELEKQEIQYNDLIFSMKDEIALHEKKYQNLQEQNSVLYNSIMVMNDKEQVYNETISHQSNTIHLERKRVKRAKRSKNVAWSLLGITVAGLTYVVIKSL
jgi:hypothetical protein